MFCPCLSVLFRWFHRMDIFPACWRQANVTSILKGPSSSSVANYQPISLTPVLARSSGSIWSQFVAVDLWNAVLCFRPSSLLIGKVWVPVMHFCVSHTLQSDLKSGEEARIVQIDFSAAYDRANHQAILYKLCRVMCCQY